MSQYDYEQGKKIEMYQFPFYALIQAAMRQSDSDNIKKLKVVFPEVYEELEARYQSPDGMLESDKKTVTELHNEYFDVHEEEMCGPPQ